MLVETILRMTQDPVKHSFLKVINRALYYKMSHSLNRVRII